MRGRRLMPLFEEWEGRGVRFGSLFSPPKPVLPPPPPPIPESGDAEVERARREVRLAAARRRGRRATLLTGGQGVTDEPLTGRPSLAGTGQRALLGS